MPKTDFPRKKPPRNKLFLSVLGDAVRDRRLELGMSKEAWGARTGLHRTYVADIERGTRNIGVLNLLRFAEALDLPLSKLLKEVESRSKRTHLFGKLTTAFCFE